MFLQLVGKKFHKLSRAADMLCLFMGDPFSFSAFNGKTINVAEFSLHVQTFWRFRTAGDENRILMTSDDIYQPYREETVDEWDYDPTVPDDAGRCIFDTKSRDLQRTMTDAVVLACDLQKTGDISIRFSNDIIFEAFACSSDEEQWRLIDYKKDLHTVCFNEDGKISCD